jgi:hypothetical protein
LLAKKIHEKCLLNPIEIWLIAMLCIWLEAAQDAVPSSKDISRYNGHVQKFVLGPSCNTTAQGREIDDYVLLVGNFG